MRNSTTLTQKQSEQWKRHNGMLLVHLISEYEKGFRLDVEVDPVEVIKIRMEDFGYKPADLAQVYGDKGTVSKVLITNRPFHSR